MSHAEERRPKTKNPYVVVAKRAALIACFVVLPLLFGWPRSPEYNTGLAELIHFGLVILLFIALCIYIKLEAPPRTIEEQRFARRVGTPLFIAWTLLLVLVLPLLPKDYQSYAAVGFLGAIIVVAFVAAVRQGFIADWRRPVLGLAVFGMAAAGLALILESDLGPAWKLLVVVAAVYVVLYATSFLTTLSLPKG